MTEELLTPKQVEAEYGFRVQRLAQWRWMGLGPDYIKTTPTKCGRILYRRSAIERHLEAQTITGGAR
ncbi:DNA-binding protein [Streptomyces sp. 1222.5]|uniref:DNA-binding protein n=1 Tax=Streptomyces sp. 1222.5 TaxID=1881026 RepID=UPI003EBA3D15